jgi:hypothetical protein
VCAVPSEPFAIVSEPNQIHFIQNATVPKKTRKNQAVRIIDLSDGRLVWQLTQGWNEGQRELVSAGKTGLEI